MLAFFDQLLKRKLLLSVLLVCVLPFSLWAAVAAFRGLSNNVYDWLPSEFESKQELGTFVELFASAELLMVSWPACTLDDIRVGQFKEALLKPSANGRLFFREIITGPEIRDYFEVEPGNMSTSESRQRMAGWIVSRKSEQTGLLTIVSAAGAADRHAVLRHVYAAADLVENLSREDLKVAGPTIEGVAVDQASQENLVELNVASFAICFLLLLVCFRNLRIALLILLIALFNQQLSLAMIHYAGTHLDSVLLLTANLTFVLSIAVGVHFVNYYRDALHECPSEQAPAQACVAAFVPTSLATITTSLGLISLTASEVRPLMRFGGFSAAAVLIAAVTTIVYVAVHFAIWPLRRTNGRGAAAASSRKLNVCAKGIRFLRWPLILLAVLGLVTGFAGARRLQTAVGLKQLVTAETRIIRDYNWLEAELGPLIPVEILLAMPTSSDAREMLRQFRQINAVHKALEAADSGATVISTATFVPDPPATSGSIRQITAVARFRRELFRNQERLSSLGYLRNVDGMTYWRLTVRAPAMSDVDYGELLARLRRTVEQATTSVEPRDVIITGGVPLIYQVQQQLLHDLIVSFLLAFGLICLALMIVLRSAVCGLICMIPNLFPCAVVFGMLGWLDIRIEVGTVLTACAALGIAVDDSLHFITWFRRHIAEGKTRTESVAYAYRRCGAAMIQTTLVCTLGLIVFAYSSFAPMQRFAWCMFALLTTALFADLVILPAILLSALGRPFVPRSGKKPQSLRDLAWRVAGPRDALINFMINAPIAVLVYWSADRVPLAGPLSLLTICGPMSFLLPTITTFFGYLNGVGARKSGFLPPAWPAEMGWKRSALIWGIGSGLLSCASCFLVLQALGQAWPDFTLSKWEAVAAVGLLSAAMGYGFHSIAVSRTSTLGLRRDCQ